MATNDIGRVTPIWRGLYNAATAYELNDIVIDAGGSVWWHKGQEITTGTAPAAGDVWAAVIDMGVFASEIQAAIATAQAAVAAAQAAETGVDADVRRAETAAGNAETYAQNAQTSAADAGAKEQGARMWASTASSFANTAEQARQRADQSRQSAEAAQTGAETAQTGAEAAQTGAETAQTAAETAQTAAEMAAGNAQTSASASAASAASAAQAALTGNLAPVYSATSKYKAGDMRLYDGTLYECNTDITTAEEWTPEHWDAVKLAPEVADIKKAVNDADIRIVKDFLYQNGYVNSSGVWGSLSSCRTAFLAVKPGDVVEVTGNPVKGCVVCVLQSYPTVVAGETPPFSEDSNWTVRKTVAVDTTATYTMPEDAAYFAFTLRTTGDDSTPAMLKLNGIDYAKTVRECLTDVLGEIGRIDGRIDETNAEMDLLYQDPPSEIWTSGALSSSAGTITTSTARIRTKGTLSDIAEISVDDGWKYMIFAYTDATANTDSMIITYIGVWNGTTFAKSANWLTGKTDLRAAGNHYYRLILAKSDDVTITVEDRVHIHLNMRRPHAMSALPALELTGAPNVIAAMTKDNAVNLTGQIFGQTGTCKVKWQGSSSSAYPKKNYKLTFDTGFTGFDAWERWRKFTTQFRASTGDTSTQPSTASRWGVQTKYVAKANWVDPSAARNVVCARLWGQIVKARIAAGEVTDGRAASPNYGAVDGFPLEIKINGVSNGLYTMTIPKEPWMFAMGVTEAAEFLDSQNYAVGDYVTHQDTLYRFKAAHPAGAWIGTDADAVNAATEYVVSSESSNLDQCKWLALPEFGQVTQGSLTDTDFKIEYNGGDDANLKASFSAAVGAAMAASGASWQEAVSPYVDIGSALDYYIFACCVHHSDGLPHNIIYGSYDGAKWFFNAYDLDSTFGIDAYGSSWGEVWPTLNVEGRRCQFRYAAQQHKIFGLLYANNKAEIKARYQALRAGILSEENVWHELSQFIVGIPTRDYDADRLIWPDQPGTATATLEQYMQFYRMHCARLDAEVEAM